MNQVELHQCYFWICEECAQENYVRPIEVDMPIEDKVEMFRKFERLEPWAEVDMDIVAGFGMMGIPEQVTCPQCGAVFSTTETEQV